MKKFIDKLCLRHYKSIFSKQMRIDTHWSHQLQTLMLFMGQYRLFVDLDVMTIQGSTTIARIFNKVCLAGRMSSAMGEIIRINCHHGQAIYRDHKKHSKMTIKQVISLNLWIHHSRVKKRTTGLRNKWSNFSTIGTLISSTKMKCSIKKDKWIM